MTAEQEIMNIHKKRRGNVVMNQYRSFLFVGGHGPEDEWTGDPYYTGHLGKELTVEDGYKAAQKCAENILSVLQEYLGTLDRVDCVVKAFGLISSTPDFTEHEQVMDGFSDRMVEVLGDRGVHARTAMGTSNLPGNIPVEIEAIIKIKE